MGSRPEISATHENAAQLIPWLINGTLDADEAASVRAHLAICPDCRADFDAEQRLYAAIRGDGPLVFSGEPSFGKLMARIDADDFAATNAKSPPSEAPAVPITRPSSRTASSRWSARPQVWRSPAVVRWLAAAAVIEAVGLGFGAWAWHARSPAGAPAYALAVPGARSDAAPYRTLTTPAPSYTIGPRVRVVFRPGLSLNQLQELLRSVGAHIVDGPSDARVYTLGFANPAASTEALDERVDALRADPNVLFAEPAVDRP